MLAVQSYPIVIGNIEANGPDDPDRDPDCTFFKQGAAALHRPEHFSLASARPISDE